MLKKVFLLAPVVLTAGLAQAQFRIGARAGFNLKNLVRVFALFFAVSFISCNKDDDDIGTKYDIVGTWLNVREELWEEDKLTHTTNFEGGVIIAFTSDGNFAVEGGTSGTWSYIDNILTLIDNKGGKPEEVYDVIKLTAIEMILERKRESSSVKYIYERQ